MNEIEIHSWSPVVWALQHPQYFYPGLGIIFLLAAITWWCVPYFLSRRSFPDNPSKRQAAETSLRTALTLFYTGSVVALGIIGAVIQFQANLERDFRQQQLALSAENAKRFDNAVERLRSTSAPLQNLSALSAFSNLIKQDGFYWPTVAEVLEYFRLIVQQGGDVNRPEISNALWILSTREWSKQSTEPFPLDFSGLDLHNLTFSGLQLWGTNFQNTNLSGAILPGAKLEGADLFCADLQNTRFEKSSLFQETAAAELGSKLANVNFRNANLSNVVFKHNSEGSVDTTGACFEGAIMDDADISHFDLQNVSGLTIHQIEATRRENRPVLPPNFTLRNCQPFEEICRNTPHSK
jgi:uncharacterized protein YjbI with pentapeptide repeats